MSKRYDIEQTASFKRAVRLAKKRGHKMELLWELVDTLARGEKLPDKHKDHLLRGKWGGYRECHIQPNWLLIYRIRDDVLVLTLVHTGTHSDLFPDE